MYGIFGSEVMADGDVVDAHPLRGVCMHCKFDRSSTDVMQENLREL